VQEELADHHSVAPEVALEAADNKWFTRIVVGAAIIDALGSLDLRYPKLSRAQRRELAAARERLLAEP
jgi:hypothetical protein